MPLDNTRRHAPIAAKMRELLGPNGEGWCRNIYHDNLYNRSCLIGAWAIATGNICSNGLVPCDTAVMAAAILRPALPEGIYPEDEFDAVTQYNDNCEGFADILRAIDVLEEIEIEQALTSEVIP